MKTFIVGVGMVLSFPVVCLAQDPPSPSIEVRGFVSIASSLNFDGPAERTNTLRVFDFDDRRFKLDVAEVVLQRTATSVSRFGFRADLVGGDSVPRISAASGLFRDPETGKATPGLFDIQQAYASYMLPVGSGLRIDAGKFTTHVGAEVIEGYDGFDDTYSRGYLFGFAEPATHTGVRLSYSITSAVSALVVVSNGWDNVRDNNSGKTVGGQLAVVQGRFSVFANYVGGPEQTGRDDLRHLFNLVTIVKPTASSTLTLGYDYGRDTHLIEGRDAVWTGASASLAMAADSRAGIAIRGEVFADRDGVRTGQAQTLIGLTVTPSIKAGRHVIVRSEVRHDRSSVGVFTSGGSASHRQLTVAGNLLIIF